MIIVISNTTHNNNTNNHICLMQLSGGPPELRIDPQSFAGSQRRNTNPRYICELSRLSLANPSRPSYILVIYCNICIYIYIYSNIYLYDLS